MKKSELKQLIRECYKEVIIENSNPFNATVEEDERFNPVKESNPFNATVEEGIAVTDDSVDSAIYRMKQDIKNLGKKSSYIQYKEDLKKIPLFRGIFDRRFFTAENEPQRGMLAGDSNTTVNYGKHFERWNNVVKNANEKEKKEAKDLLTVLKDNDGKPLKVDDDLRLTSSNGKDSIVLRCKVSNLLKIFTFGIADSKLTSLRVMEATGTFEGVTTNKNIAADKAELTKIGNAIVHSVEAQGGKVNRDGYKVSLGGMDGIN